MKTEKRSSEEIYIERLVKEYHYPSASIRREVLHSFGKARYRLDIVVMKEEKPYIVVEIKKNVSNVNLDQLAGYVRATEARFTVVSDGYVDHCYRSECDGYETRLREIPDIPSYEKEIENIGSHSNKELVSIDSKRLSSIVWELANIYREQGYSGEEALRDILKVLLLKVYDENSNEGLFRARFDEPPENVQSRISALAVKAAKKHPNILKEPLLLKKESLTRVIQILQKYSLRESAKEIAGSKLPVSEILGPHSYVRSIPRDVIRLIMDLLDPGKNAKFIDPACGVGGLLVEAAKRGAEVTGIEANIGEAQYAEVSLALSNLSGKVLVQDSLHAGQISNQRPDGVQPGSYDYTAVVPPFGSKISDARLNDFSLGMNKKSQSKEALLLELSLLLLKPGGKMAIILPEGFLFGDSTYDAREFILRKSIVNAVISLPAGAFLPLSAIKTSLLLLENSPDKGTSPDNVVFVAIPQGVQDFDSVVESFWAFKSKDIVPRRENIFTAKIMSARQMNASYLMGMLSSEYAVDRLGVVADVESSKAELRELVSFTTGVRLEDIGERDVNGDVWYVRAGNVGEFVVDLKGADRLKTIRDVSRWKPTPGDILMTRAGTVGRVALVDDDIPPIIVGSNVVKLSIRDKRRLLPEFLLGYLSSKVGATQISMYTVGSTIRAVSVSGLGQIRVPLPPVEKQRKVAAQVRKLIETKREASRIISELKAREADLLEELDSLVVGG